MMSESGEEPSSGRLRRIFSRLAVGHDELEAEHLHAVAVSDGATPIGACGDRELVTISGTLRTVTLRPRAGVPALEAELYDGSGTVALIWLGRRRIAGVEPGRAVRAHGRLSCSDGRSAIFNPRYELRPGGGPG